MKDRGCSRRTRAAGRRAGAPSIAVAMDGVKRKLRRARTRERQDSRAMRHTLSFAVVDMEPLQRLGFTRIVWRLREICGLVTVTHYFTGIRGERSRVGGADQ